MDLVTLTKLFERYDMLYTQAKDAGDTDEMCKYSKIMDSLQDLIILIRE